MEKRLFIYYTEMDTPIGPITVFSSEVGVCKIEFGTIENVAASMEAWLKKQHIKYELVQNDALLEPIKQQLNEYFTGQRYEFSIPLDLHGTPFQKKVWESLQSINYGDTCSYKDIAKKIGAPKAVRAIGSANNKNPVPLIIPCHRVIGSNGALVGYGGGIDKKEFLLHLEREKNVNIASS
ncbi:methylated-DNA--[protein]-cysteine S-methyltransferase [Pseudalkalibacillus caeni]|uniref:Methylated-DNA--protein-cysteine methyltransferase n=1 Tax=Exobacillus caeni TaxID=2574798 RepID=A0A5R9F6L9_9BACL|nr:methylated-DNA--[protein]-cysteine S-methyltransferase [Pseudalkalibacillus caeni]TLS37996.1 methylated-DNA--[protein]-cysteine S-methyltransferase [Pseudalkalibacillus caeni]